MALAAASEYDPSTWKSPNTNTRRREGSSPITWNHTAPTCRDTPQSIARYAGNRGSNSAAVVTCFAASNRGNQTPSPTSSTSASSSCRPSRVPSYLFTIRSKNDGARLARLSYVVPRAVAVVGSSIRSVTSRSGLGVVVTQSRGSTPSRRPNSRLSNAAGYRNAANSSSHAQSCCGPLKRSGSSAENVVARAPLGQVSRRRVGSYRGRNHGGLIARMPLSPLTIVSRTSAAVAPTSAIRPAAPLSARRRTHSAAARVLPDPRPISNSQVRQSPSGGRWFGRARGCSRHSPAARPHGQPSAYQSHR